MLRCSNSFLFPIEQIHTSNNPVTDIPREDSFFQSINCLLVDRPRPRQGDHTRTQLHCLVYHDPHACMNKQHDGTNDINIAYDGACSSRNHAHEARCQEDRCSWGGRVYARVHEGGLFVNSISGQLEPVVLKFLVFVLMVCCRTNLEQNSYSTCANTDRYCLTKPYSRESCERTCVVWVRDHAGWEMVMRQIIEQYVILGE
jgi:hypothetical protein